MSNMFSLSTQLFNDIHEQFFNEQQMFKMKLEKKNALKDETKNC